MLASNASPYIMDNNTPTGTKYYSSQIGFTTFQIDSRYQNLLPQGDSAYGCVVSAFDTLMNRMVAIKKVRDPLSQLNDTKRILRELKLLRHFIGHENISSVYDIMTDPPDNPNFHDVYIVTNLFDSDLDQVIKSTEILTDHHHQFFIYQTLRALKYIHSANVIHRDLKPSNLLLTSECDLAICDFGLGRGMNETAHDPLTQYVVTRWYRAPELLCRSPYSKAVDMWSLGCIFAEILTKAPFFTGDNAHQQLKSILNKMGCPPRSKLNFIKSKTALTSIVKHKAVNTRAHFSLNFPEGTNFLGLDLLKRMLQFNPNDRITVEDAIRHPFLRVFHDPRKEPVCASLFDFHCVSPAAVAAYLQQQQQQLSSLSLPPNSNSSVILSNINNDGDEVERTNVVSISQEPHFKKHRIRSISPSPFTTSTDSACHNRSSPSSLPPPSPLSEMDMLSAVSAMISLSSSGPNGGQSELTDSTMSGVSVPVTSDIAPSSSVTSSALFFTASALPQRSSFIQQTSSVLATVPEDDEDNNGIADDNMSVSVVDEEQQRVQAAKNKVQQQKLENHKSTTSTGSKSSSNSSSRISSSSSVTSSQFHQEVTNATFNNSGVDSATGVSPPSCDLDRDEARILVLREVMWYRPLSPNIAAFLASTCVTGICVDSVGATGWNQM